MKKRNASSKPESDVLALKGKVKKGIGRVAASAQRQVEDKGEWVAGKVNKAIGKIERMIGSRDEPK